MALVEEFVGAHCAAWTPTPTKAPKEAAGDGKCPVAPTAKGAAGDGKYPVAPVAPAAKGAANTSAYAKLTLDELEALFVRHVRQLTTELVRLSPDEVANRAQRRIALALDSNPKFVFDTVGTHLANYSDKIFAGDGKFFEQRAFGDDELPKDNEDKRDLIKAVIPRLQSMWGKLDDTKRTKYVTHVQNMLRIYLEYRIKAIERRAGDGKA